MDEVSGCMVYGFRFRVSYLGCRVENFRGWSFGFQASGLGFWDSGFGFRAALHLDRRERPQTQSAVDRIWLIQDSQGQILASAFR